MYENIFYALNDLMLLFSKIQADANVKFKEQRLPERTFYPVLEKCRVGDPIFFPMFADKTIVSIPWKILRVKARSIVVADQMGRERGEVNMYGQAIFDDGYGPRLFFVEDINKIIERASGNLIKRFA